MPNKNISLGVVVLLALFVSGCESDGGIAGRTREKSTVYATLKISEKRFIDKGIIANGFTPDMVYMAMGHPSQFESKAYSEGTRELWTYSRYYPNVDSVVGYRPPVYATEAPYQRSHTHDVDGTYGAAGAQIPNGMDKNQGVSLFRAGPPQGNSSSEPPELRSYKFIILFKDGKVARFGVEPNVN